MPGPRILLLDIETAPGLSHVWGIRDENIPIERIVRPGYMLCFAAKWYGDKSPVIFDRIDYRGYDTWTGGIRTLRPNNRRMLRSIHSLLSEADIIVHYNGQRFDVPVINTEFLKGGLGPPMPFKQVDLYKVARSKFSFLSNKFAFIGPEIGVGRKVKHNGFETWTGCMADDAAAWADMKKYNIGDVHPLLGDTYNKFLPWIDNHPNIALYDDGTKMLCRNCGSPNLRRRVKAENKVTWYWRWSCNDCGRWLKGSPQKYPGAKRAALLT